MVRDLMESTRELTRFSMLWLDVSDDDFSHFVLKFNISGFNEQNLPALIYYFRFFMLEALNLTL